MFKRKENEFDKIKRIANEESERRKKERELDFIECLKTDSWFSYYGRIWKCEDPPKF